MFLQRNHIGITSQMDNKESNRSLDACDPVSENFSEPSELDAVSQEVMDAEAVIECCQERDREDGAAFELCSNSRNEQNDTSCDISKVHGKLSTDAADVGRSLRQDRANTLAAEDGSHTIGQERIDTFESSAHRDREGRAISNEKSNQNLTVSSEMDEVRESINEEMADREASKESDCGSSEALKHPGIDKRNVAANKTGRECSKPRDRLAAIRHNVNEEVTIAAASARGTGTFHGSGSIGRNGKNKYVRLSKHFHPISVNEISCSSLC